jgi:hypothetical protein
MRCADHFSARSHRAKPLSYTHVAVAGSIPVVDDRAALTGVIDETDLVQDGALVGDRIPASAGRLAGTTPSRRRDESPRSRPPPVRRAA